MKKRPVRSFPAFWFAVRCVFIHKRSRRVTTYEERITIWRAKSADTAIRLAEREARAYARSLSWDGVSCRHLGFAESYETSLRRLTDGDEVFSLLRDSRMDSGRFLDRHFDTGREHRMRTAPGQKRR